MGKNDVGIKTNYTIYSIPSGALDFLETNHKKIEYLKSNKIPGVKIRKGHNVVPLFLRRSLAQLIAGSSVTPTFKANIIALGSDSTIALETDTKLGAEFLRSNFDNRYTVGNIAYLDVYFTKGVLGIVNLQEIGVFVDGILGIPDSGYLLSRINVNESLSGVEDLAINASFTILG